jgi:eukaryotic-like serine/threonine-protein kinase
MTLTTGARIGPYDVVDSIGAGGMGEVYRARDSRLGRDVALKVLPDAFASDAERLARFEREAQVLAALNHPHIASIYGVEEAGGVRALVLELVTGDTLAERLEQGAIPFGEALPLARQIVVALEAAHEQGIIHRDLKPSNIKITPGGTVKVLDFGLAKLGAPAGGSSAADTRAMASQSPTITSPAMMTGVGLILGTAAYMAPEQAKGRAADRKSDIWAFGCVFYEMLTGKRAFDGEDVSETMAAVIRAEPDWSRLPASTPPHVRTLLRRCLQKDPRKRLPDIGAARLELDDEQVETMPPTAPAVVARPWWRRALPAVCSAIVAGVAAGLLVWSLVPVPDRPVTRIALAGLDGVKQFSTLNYRVLDLSSDGTRLVFAADSQLYVKSKDDFAARPIPGTQDATSVISPTFSPDGNQVAFVSGSDRMLKRIAASGGVAIPVTALASPPLGISWGPDDTILIGQPGGIMQVRATGGKAEPLVDLDDGELSNGPQMLPGNRVLFTLGKGVDADRWDRASIVVQPLPSGPRQTIVEGGSDGRYVPTGHIVYAVGGTLFAVPVDPDRLTPTGPHVSIVQGVRRSPLLTTRTAVAQFAFSSTGDLAYVPGSLESAAAGRLTIVEPAGSRQSIDLPRARYEAPRISPDDTRVAVVADGNIFVHEMATRRMPQLTLTGRNRFPVWAGDERIAFQSNRDGDSAIFWQRADGADAATRLTTPEKGSSHVPESWSPRHNVLLYSALDDKTGEASLWAYSVTEKKATRIGKTTSTRQFNAEFSPNGRFIAYTLRTAGVSIRAEPFPPTGVDYMVSARDTGHHPLWSRDGTRLMYFPGAGPLVSIDANTVGVPRFGSPTKVAAGVPNNVTADAARNVDIFKDGRFIMTDDGQGADGALATGVEFRFVLNWFEELKRLAPPGP